eukprot:gene15491-biopygen2166
MSVGEFFRCSGRRVVFETFQKNRQPQEDFPSLAPPDSGTMSGDSTRSAPGVLNRLVPGASHTIEVEETDSSRTRPQPFLPQVPVAAQFPELRVVFEAARQERLASLLRCLSSLQKKGCGCCRSSIGSPSEHRQRPSVQAGNGSGSSRAYLGLPLLAAAAGAAAAGAAAAGAAAAGAAAAGAAAAGAAPAGAAAAGAAAAGAAAAGAAAAGAAAAGTAAAGASANVIIPPYSILYPVFAQCADHIIETMESSAIANSVTFAGEQDMPAPRPRHSCQIVAYSPRHARAMPAPVSCSPRAGRNGEVVFLWTTSFFGSRFEPGPAPPPSAPFLSFPAPSASLLELFPPKSTTWGMGS